MLNSKATCKNLEPLIKEVRNKQESSISIIVDHTKPRFLLSSSDRMKTK